MEEVKPAMEMTLKQCRSTSRRTNVKTVKCGRTTRERVNEARVAGLRKRKEACEENAASSIKRERRVKKVQSDLVRLAGLRKRKKASEKNDEGLKNKQNKSKKKVPEFSPDSSIKKKNPNKDVKLLDQEPSVDHENIIQGVPQSSEGINASGAAITQNKNQLSNAANSSGGLESFKVVKMPLSQFTLKGKKNLDKLWKRYYKEDATFSPVNIEDTALIESLFDGNPGVVRCQRRLTIINLSDSEEITKRLSPESANSNESDSVSDEDENVHNLSSQIKEDQDQIHLAPKKK